MNPKYASFSFPHCHPVSVSICLGLYRFLSEKMYVTEFSFAEKMQLKIHRRLLNVCKNQQIVRQGEVLFSWGDSEFSVKSRST